MTFFQITLPYELLDIQQIQQCIKTYNNRLGTVVDGCGYEEITRILTIVSNEALSTEDENNISAALSAYTNPPIPVNFRIVNTGLQKIDVQCSEFRSIFEYEYQIDALWGISQFNIRTLALLNANRSSITYTIRIVNVNNNEVIGSGIFTSTNYTENIVELNEGVVFNGSNTQTLEIQIKTTTPGVLSVLSAQIRENSIL